MLLLTEIQPNTSTLIATFSSIDGCVTAVSTFLLAILTIFIAVYAYKAYKESKKTFLENVKYNHRQSAETTIFKLIEFHYNILSNISIKSNGTEFSGVKFFEKIYSILKNKFIDRYSEKIHKEVSEIKFANILLEQLEYYQYIDQLYGALYDRYPTQIGNYCKNLYMVLNYLDGLEIKHNEKMNYIGFLKAQLSKYEIKIIAYNCIWVNGKTDKVHEKEFSYLARKYNLLSAFEVEDDSSGENEMKSFFNSPL